MSGTFKRARVEELPAWLSDEIGEAHQATVGEMQDVELRKLKDGVLATLLDTAPDDALPHLGATYYLPPFLKETAERHRARLDASWETHERGGRRDGITGILSDMQIVDVDLREDHEWTGAPGEWFSRIWPIVGPDFGPVLQTLPLTTPFETSEADGVSTGGATTMGSTAVLAEVRQMRREILKWKHPGSVPVHLIMVWDGGAVQGLVSTPFTTMPGAAAYVPIGKFQGQTVTTAPFVPGGFYE